MPGGIFRGSLRLNRNSPWVVYSVMALCILVYLLDTVSGWINSYIYGFNAYGWLSILGMKDNEFILAGQWWRFLTANFLHGGIQHILFNMFSLYMWGRFVENIYGHAKTLLIVLASALMTTAVSFAFSPNNSLGASGIAFGLMGALLAFGRHNPAAFERFFGGGMTAMVVINLLYGFFASSVDGFGHLGGLVGGFLGAMAAAGIIRNRAAKETLPAAAVFVLALVIAGLVGWNRWQ